MGMLLLASLPPSETPPFASKLVARLAATDVVASDGARVTSWTDSVNGIVFNTAISGLGPIYKTNRFGARPSLTFDSGPFLTKTGPNAVRTALDSLNYTIFVFFKTLGTTDRGSLFNPNWMRAAGSTVGVGNVNLTYSASTFSSAIIAASPTEIVDASAMFGVNGGMVGVTGPEAANTIPIAIGAWGDGQFPVNAEIAEILVYGDFRNQEQCLQIEKWGRDKHGQAYPWALIPRMMVLQSDSIAYGSGNPDTNNLSGLPPAQLATALGLTPGQYCNLAIPGVSVPTLKTQALTWVDPIGAVLNKRVGLIAMEWYNSQFGDGTYMYDRMQEYLAARRAGSTSTDIVFLTSSDVSTPPLGAGAQAIRAVYNGLFDAHPTLNIDSYVPLHNSPDIGVDGAVAAHPGNFEIIGAGVGPHLSPTGQPFLVNLMAAGFNALP